jgi:hypothetical protein
MVVWPCGSFTPGTSAGAERGLTGFSGWLFFETFWLQ